MQTNILSCGDNLDVLRRHRLDAIFGLVCLDPPYKGRA